MSNENVTSNTLSESAVAGRIEGEVGECWNPTLAIPQTPEGRMDRLTELFSVERKTQVEIGELLIVMTKKDFVSLKILAEKFGKDRTTLTNYRNVVLCAKKEGIRYDAEVPYSALENAYRCRKIAPMKEALPIILKGGTVPWQQGELKTFKRFTHPQAAKIAIKMHAKAKEDQRSIKAAPLLLAKGAEVIGRCHHAPFLDVLAKVPDGSIKLAWIDPPYGQFRRNADGSYPMGMSVSRNEADNNDATGALAVACEPWAVLRSKLAPGGVAALWQAGTGPLRPEIQEAIRLAGFVSPIPVIWDKKKMQMCDPTWPWVTAIEIAYVTWPQGTQPINHTVNSYRPNIVQCAPVQHSIEHGSEHHTYEKPEEVCRIFVERHTRPGELVVDMCGCSGSMCIVANRLGRQWVYSESNKANFEWGSRRISEAVGDTQDSVAVCSRITKVKGRIA